MEASLDGVCGVGVGALLLTGEPCLERFVPEGGSGEGERSALSSSWDDGCDRVDGAGDGDRLGPRPVEDCWANGEQRPGGAEDPRPGFVGAADRRDSAPPLGGWFAIE